MLDALDPFAYEYAGLASLYSPGLQRSDYDAVRRWWDELKLGQWIPQDFPITVRCSLRGSPVFAAFERCEYVCVCAQPAGITGMCCSTFVVSRSRIIARPKEMYQRIYDWALNPVCYLFDHAYTLVTYS